MQKSKQKQEQRFQKQTFLSVFLDKIWLKHEFSGRIFSFNSENLKFRSVTFSAFIFGLFWSFLVNFFSRNHACLLCVLREGELWPSGLSKGRGGEAEVV